MEVDGKIKQWLEKEGYPLEMRINKKIRDNTDFQTRQGWYYQDPETEASREIDIVCSLTEPYGFAEINFALECKSTKKPWVLFTSDDAVSGYNRILAFSLVSKLAYTALANLINEGTDSSKEIPWLWKDGRVGYGLSQAFNDNNNDVAYKAVLSSVKAATWLQENSFWQNTEFRKFTFCFPVVVTSSPLYECYLNDEGETELKEIEYGFLFFNQHIQGYKSTSVAVVSESSIDNFLKECKEIGDTLLSKFTPVIESEWRKLLNQQEERT